MAEEALQKITFNSGDNNERLLLLLIKKYQLLAAHHANGVTEQNKWEVLTTELNTEYVP